MATQEERSATCRAKLVSAAREAFETRGYPGASLDEITKAAGVTKGAFYHHFADKKAMFEAVFDVVGEELIARIAAGEKDGDAWDMMRSGCMTYLDAVADPKLQQVFLRDGPTVLGWGCWQERERALGLGLVTAGLLEARKTGRIAPADVEALAILLHGALCEGARSVAEAKDPKCALAGVRQGVNLLLDGIERAPN